MLKYNLDCLKETVLNILFRKIDAYLHMELLSNPSTASGSLAQKAANGDSRSFQQLYDSIAAKMYSLCLRFAGNANDANDCFQEGFVKLYKNLESFRDEGSFEGWARKVFVGVCIDFINRRKLSFSEIDGEIELESNDLSGYDNLNNEDLMKIIIQLPDIYRTIVNLNLIEGYNHKEIAVLLNITEEGSRTQLFRARALLQKKIK